MSDELPFRSEYAKSGRAGCKGCKAKIEKDELRLAVMVQSPVFDGRTPNWYHFRCFFGKFKVKSEGDIAHFESLRYEDQEKIKEKLVGGNKGVATTSGAGTSKAKGAKAKVNLKRKSTGDTDLEEFSIEYAKSSRASCRGCLEKIEKGVVRIAKTDRESETALRYGPCPGWYHSECFIQARQFLEYYADAESLPGFMTLGVDDQKKLKEQIKKIKKEPKDEVDSKKPKAEPVDETALKVQSKNIFKFHDWLKNSLTKKELVELLEFNEQEVPKGESRILDRLSDCMAFGCLEECPECNGQLVFSNDGYRCTGNATEWTKCQYITKKPKRGGFEIPPELAEHTFLARYKCKKGERIFPERAARSVSSMPPISTVRTKRPLDLVKVAIGLKTETPREELKRKIVDLGGRVVTAIDESVGCIISTEDDVKKMTKKMREAKDSDIHVVSESFLQEVQVGNVAAMIIKHNIGSWGASPEKRLGASAMEGFQLPKSAAAGSSKFSMAGSGKSMKQKITLKGGAAVDPDCEIGGIAHVLMDGTSPFNAVLGKVDLTRGTNSFYKLQLLESDRGHQCWVFRSWGRVGTTIGGTKLDKFDTRMEAVHFFKAQYEEKTQNIWEDRDNFEKRPNAFYPLDIDYGGDAEDLKKLQPGSNSKLPKSVQELICLIFDVEKMKKAMLEFEIDLEKMPLGKLSKKQIEKAYSVLKEIEGVLKSGKNETKLLDASNRFYTLIPHNFGMEKPPLLNSNEIIQLKVGMLESLLEMEVAYTLLKDTGSDSSLDPVDQHYKQINTKLEPVEKGSNEFDTLKNYVSNTHASTHNMYQLDVEEIFKVDRTGEAKRYKPFKKLHNRQLLWHGSRTTNYAGILTNGLKIAPPEAPVTGYMFGKGIYFADMVSKSANYCCTSKANPTGLLLLCEVALGNMHELTQANHVTKLPTGTHSTKGIGKTHPDPTTYVTRPDGVVIPSGEGVKAPINQTSLLYNEYIVYDTAQVNIQYLLKVNFKYRY